MEQVTRKESQSTYTEDSTYSDEEITQTPTKTNREGTHQQQAYSIHSPEESKERGTTTNIQTHTGSQTTNSTYSTDERKPTYSHSKSGTYPDILRAPVLTTTTTEVKRNSNELTQDDSTLTQDASTNNHSGVATIPPTVSRYGHPGVDRQQLPQLDLNGSSSNTETDDNPKNGNGHRIGNSQGKECNGNNNNNSNKDKSCSSSTTIVSRYGSISSGSSSNSSRRTVRSDGLYMHAQLILILTFTLVMEVPSI